jgi:hypothetical protein
MGRREHSESGLVTGVPCLHHENTEMLWWKIQYLPTIGIIHMCMEKYPTTTGSTFQFNLTLLCLVWVGVGKFAQIYTGWQIIGNLRGDILRL